MRLAICFFGLLSIASTSLRAEKVDATALGLLQNGRVHNAILGSGSPSLHIEAEFQIYGADGKPSTGTISLLTLASGAWRRTLSIDGKGLQEISSDTTWKSVADDGFQRPVMEELLWSMLIQPIPSAESMKDRSISLHTEKSSSGEMLCAVLGELPGTPAGTYCFGKEPELLRTIESSGGLRALLGGYKKAGPVYIPTQITVSVDRSTVAWLRVTSLSGVPGDTTPDISLEDPREHQVAAPPHIASLDQSDHTKWISKPAPRYPQIAKELHISGTVFLLVTIAEDGSVRSVQPLASPHASLTESSAAACTSVAMGTPVGQWEACAG